MNLQPTTNEKVPKVTDRLHPDHFFHKKGKPGLKPTSRIYFLIVEKLPQSVSGQNDEAIVILFFKLANY